MLHCPCAYICQILIIRNHDNKLFSFWVILSVVIDLFLDALKILAYTLDKKTELLILKHLPGQVFLVPARGNIYNFSPRLQAWQPDIFKSD